MTKPGRVSQSQSVDTRSISILQEKQFSILPDTAAAGHYLAYYYLFL
jgi:hypothetical protein